MTRVRYVLAVAATLCCAQCAMAGDVGKVEMIFWEYQRWDGTGYRERITLWADGNSEVRTRIHGVIDARPGWSAEKKDPWTVLRKESVFSKAETKRLFERAITEGIRELKTFPATYNDGHGWLVGVRIDGKLIETRIPMFTDPEAKDDWGSDNHKRFQHVQLVLEPALIGAQRTPGGSASR